VNDTGITVEGLNAIIGVTTFFINEALRIISHIVNSCW
jgi:hypothetical protein